ncbi:MAG TPA: HigA family addiction module antitoxin [Methylocella sp.]|nr:HigA family addiction module antitoxin [Methylocella sp.]
MAMKNSPHSCLLLEDEIGALDLTVAQAAKGPGVTRQQLHRVISGSCGISPEMALRLEKGIGSSAGAWLAMQANYDLAQLGKRVAGIAVTCLAPRAG